MTGTRGVHNKNNPASNVHNRRTASLLPVETRGAGDGNRTRMASLEGWGSTIELRPHTPPQRGGLSVPVAHVVAGRERWSTGDSDGRVGCAGQLVSAPGCGAAW